MTKKIFIKSKYWDWSLLLSIFLYQAIPALYNSYSIYLIGNSDPSESGLAIISQWQTVQIISEIIQESLIFPIYFFIGSIIHDNSNDLISKRIASCIKIILAILLPSAIIIHSQLDTLVSLTNTPVEIIKETTTYLTIRTWSIVVSIINISLFIAVESLKKKPLIILILTCKTLLYVLLDSWFYGGYEFSLNLGINGVALSNILTESILFLIVYFYLKIQSNIDIFQDFFSFKFQDFKLFRKISSWLAVESIVRNLFYLTMVVSLINSLGPSRIGGYYLTMHLFWGILLVPILAISETLKVQTANFSNSIDTVKRLMYYALTLSLFVILLWMIVVPFAGKIFGYLSNNTSIHDSAIESFYVLFIPYCLLSINMIIDSVFYGLGKTKFLAYQSIATNLVVYTTAYLAYKTGIWEPTFISILIVFSSGIIVDSILTIVYWKILYKSRIHKNTELAT